MHLRYRRDPPHGVAQRRLDVVVVAGIGLQVQQRCNDLQAIANAVVDLAQQHFALRRQRRVAITRGMDLGFGVVASLADLRLPHRAFDSDMQ